VVVTSHVLAAREALDLGCCPRLVGPEKRRHSRRELEHE
jgi:hypothetical protein